MQDLSTEVQKQRRDVAVATNAIFAHAGFEHRSAKAALRCRSRHQGDTCACRIRAPKCKRSVETPQSPSRRHLRRQDLSTEVQKQRRDAAVAVKAIPADAGFEHRSAKAA